MNPILKRGLTLGFILMIGLLAITPLPRSAHSQNPAPQRIESDDASVTRAGSWTSQAASQASGGSYLYSSGADDVLTLQFSGPSIEVIFVAGPSLGTLAINVDDIVLRTVITTADQTAYQQSSRIDYLSDDPHTLKVYAQAGGIVAIDAFVVTLPSDGSDVAETSAANGQSRSACDSTTATQRASEATGGTEGDSESVQPMISDTGRYVVFTTGSAFDGADTNSRQDVYVHDRVDCTTLRASLSTGGQQAVGTNADSADISSDGRYVIFRSEYGGFVAGDGNGILDIFRRDLQTNTTIRVSISDSEGEGDAPSYSPVVSGDGRYVAFASQATNLVAADTNGFADIFVRDVTNETTTLVSVTTSGGASTAHSNLPSISSDGRYVAFVTTAALDPVLDTNGQSDIYVRDLVNNTTTLISVGTSGFSANGESDAPAIAGDGQFVAFHSLGTNLVAGDTNSQGDVFVRDFVNSTTVRASLNASGTEGNADAGDPSISNDGRYVAFSTVAALVGDDSNAALDVYVRDTVGNVTYRTSLSYLGLQGNAFSDTPAISGDGSVVAYHSRATNLMASSDTNNIEDVYVSNRVILAAPTGLSATTVSQTQVDLAWTDNGVDEANFRVERSNDGVSGWAEIGTAPADAVSYSDTTLSCGQTRYYRVRSYRSGDGAFSAYSNVVSGASLLCPLATPTSLAVSTLSAEALSLTWTDNAADESAYLVERSLDGSTNWMLVATLAANTQTFSNRLLDCGTTYHYRVRAYRQADSAYSPYSNVAFNTTGACPVSCTHDPRVYRVSENASGTGGNDGSGVPDISDDGRYVAFQSYANNLVTGDTNSQVDIFVKDAVTCQVWRISMTSDGQQANAASYAPRISPNGRYIAFFSPASNLVAGDNNGNYDAFVVDRLLGQITLLASYNGTIPTTGSMGGVVSDNGIAAFYAVGTFAGLGPLQYALVRDLNTGVISVVSLDVGGQPQSAGGDLSISPDGRYVAFTTANGLAGGDTNGQGDVYLRDRQTNTTTWVSVGHLGQQGVGNSMIPAVSPNGRYVSFESTAENLVNNDTNLFRDVFLRDVQQSTTIRVSVSATGTQANNTSTNSVVDNNGVVYYSSSATTIVPGTSIGENQIYRYDPTTQQVTIMSRAANGTLGNGSSFSPRISSNGRFLTFESTAYNLDPDDAAGGYPDVYAVDMTILLAPSNLTASWSCATKSITLTWSDTNTDQTNYLIERSTTSTGGWSQIAAVGANVVTYSDSSLPTGTQFYYRVRAYRASDTTYTGYSDLAAATTQVCPPAAPINLTAAHHSQTSILLAWIDNANDETNFTIERSFNGTTGWSQIGSTVANVNTFTDTIYLTCGTTYYYRVRAYRSGDGVFSAYSDVASAYTTACLPDALALVNPATRSANLIRTLDNSPAGSDSVLFATGLPFGPGGQYVMGDWNGDGVDTIGVYREGAFFFTNDFGTGGTWGGIWFGLGGQPVVGRFDATINHDCLGVTDSGTWFTGDAYFALYFTCNLTSGPTPPLTFQWLSILLPTSQGFTGTFQFVAGDFDGDGVDSVAVRRGAFIAWTNVPPTTLLTQFNLAQYIGAPGTGDEGKVVTGDWDMNNVDSFGLVYQNGTFYRRNDLDWNSGAYTLQTFTPAVGTPFDVVSWRPN